MWKRDDSMVPALMKSETENGLAKLVVDVCEEVIPAGDEMGDNSAFSVDKDLISANENTPQVVSFTIELDL